MVVSPVQRAALWALTFLSPQSFFHTPAKSSQYNDGKLITADVSQYIEDVRTNSEIHGLSVSVVSLSERAEFDGWGQRTEGGDPATGETLFQLASVSKAFLSASIGILMDDFSAGRNITSLPTGIREFNWLTKIKDILPSEWGLMDEWATNKAYVRDILTHVSGLPRHEVSYGSNDTLENMISRMRYLRPAFELRQRWNYNNLMYVLGSYIIETYSGKSYPDFVKERIFIPLNMTTSGFYIGEAEKTGLLTQVFASNRRVPLVVNDSNVRLIAGAGGAISSAADLAKWTRLLLDGGFNKLTNITVIPKSTFDEITGAHSIVTMDLPFDLKTTIAYGEGWWRLGYRGHEVVQHGGNIPGISTLVTFLPNDGLAVVVLTNSNSQTLAALNITMKIVHEVLQLGDTMIDDSVLSSLSNELNLLKPEDTHSKPKARRIKFTDDQPNFEGVYSNAGYGSFTLCQASTASDYCEKVRSEFHLVDLQSRYYESPGSHLLAHWPRVWGTHLRLVPKEDPTAYTFSFNNTILLPEGFGRNKTPFEVSVADAEAKFVVRDGTVLGFGLFGTVDGVNITERMRTKTTVQEQADTWFDKVQ